jgi:hypothetical protein
MYEFSHSLGQFQTHAPQQTASYSTAKPDGQPSTKPVPIQRRQG